MLGTNKLKSNNNSIKNVCLYSGENLWGPIIDYFKSEKIWNYVMWLAPTDKANYKTNKSYMSEIDHDEYRGTGEAIYDELYKHIYKFTDMYSRNSQYGQNKYNSKTIHDILNIFNRLIDYYSYHLKKNEIELVIFPRAPHSGHDFVLYQVATALQIKTLILEQSLFPNKMYHYFNNEDYGMFETSKQITNPEPYKIEKNLKKDLFYMNKKKLFRTNKGIKDYFCFKKYGNFLKKLLFNNDLGRLLIELLDREGMEQAIFRYKTEKRYKKLLKEHSTSDVDYDKKYVYFGLHLQPEKTTSNWGGIFNDQLLAIERLSTFIPNDWMIYVKENPKQTGFMRGKWFFERLKAVKKAVLISKEVNTYQLLEHCQFASTITGTLGWEAISGGKNVLVFGWGVWYKTLPGVFTYSTKLKIADILNYSINHRELEKKMGELYAKMADGVIYKHYDKMIDGFSEENNSKQIIKSLEIILT